MSGHGILERQAALVQRPPVTECRACVIIPARNEEHGLTAALHALYAQVNLDGAPMDRKSYEVLLLLNNCTDRSAEVAHAFGRSHPGFQLHVAQRTLAPEEAHVGTARSLLMDAACARMETQPLAERTAILSTDADTLVATDWIAANLAALDAGADVVGGNIHLLPQDFDLLDAGTRAAYKNDLRLQEQVALLESLLDPDPADPWPRHLHHFGASLACRCEIYRRCGGLPAVTPLEDVAFVDALRRVGARIRHAPEVHIFTSARLDGRAEVGLSGQLRHWQRETTEGIPHLVDSAEWVEHRFKTLAALRRLNGAEPWRDDCHLPEEWLERARALHAERLPTHQFLELLDVHALIEGMFNGPQRHAEIGAVLTGLEAAISRLQGARAHPA